MPKRKAKPVETRVLAVLSCHHTAQFDPPASEGDEVWCNRCRCYRVVENNVQEWATSCQVCHNGKRFGADETSARRYAHNHATRHAHRVNVLEGFKVRSIVDPHQGELTGVAKTGKNVTTSIYAWLDENQDHSQSLRRFSEGGR